MKHTSTLVALIFLLSGCAGSSTGTDEPDETADPGTNDDGRLTLANCSGSANGVAAFYTNYFACTDISATTDGTRLSTDACRRIPAPTTTPMTRITVAFDDRGGTTVGTRTPSA